MNNLKHEVKVGIIGFGYWGKTYFRALREIDGVKVSYICDSNEKVRDIIPESISFFNDPQKAIEDGDSDTVFIITPAESHKQIAIEALKNNLNIFVEKPAFLSKSDLNFVMSKKRPDTLLFPGHIYAYNDMVNSLVQELVGTGEAIYSITSTRMALGPIRTDVGCTWDLLPHDLTIIDLLGVGEPVSVSSTAQYPLRLNHEDISNCNIEYSTGLVANVELSWIYPYKVRRTSITTSKSIYFFDETSKEIPLGIVPFKSNISEEINKMAYNRVLGNEYVKKIDFEKTEPLKNMIKTFISAVDSDDRQADRREIMRAKMIISTIEATLDSISKSGKKVNIKLNN
jgi:predicted dehydrogenase